MSTPPPPPATATPPPPPPRRPWAIWSSMGGLTNRIIVMPHNAHRPGPLHRNGASGRIYDKISWKYILACLSTWALSTYTLYSDSALLVLNGTSLNCNNALLALNWRYVKGSGVDRSSESGPGGGGGGGMISDFKKNTENILRTNARERSDRRGGGGGVGGGVTVLGLGRFINFWGQPENHVIWCMQ